MNVYLREGDHFVANTLVPAYPTVPYVPFLACPPHPTSPFGSLWPSLSSLDSSDLLLRVLKRKAVRVASYGPPPPAAQPHPKESDRVMSGYNWGDEGNYSLKEPKGIHSHLHL